MQQRPISGWAIGFIVFAGVAMVTIGILHALWGLAAIINDQFFVKVNNYAFKFDVTTWGWIQLISGVIAAIAGIYLFSGAVLARAVGVVLAILSIIFNFMALPYFPIWSIVIIALDIAVIWALTVHGRDITVES
jgi:hypothetical protein